MKHVTDHQGFNEAQDLLTQLQAEQARLTAEHAAATAVLRWDTPNEPLPSVTARAVLLMRGKPVDVNRGAQQDAQRLTEIDLRHKLEVIDSALRQQPSEVEHQRDMARAEWLEQHRDTVKIRKMWLDAVSAMRGAIEAENQLLDAAVAGGFGRAEPQLTAPYWLQRNEVAA